MQEFCDYLRDWQGRSRVELAYWDSKRSRACNLSNKLQPGSPNYIPETWSPFAYKAWVCYFGRKGCRNPCRFMIRARYLPSRKKVVCKVMKHGGLDARRNGHNHSTGEAGTNIKTNYTAEIELPVSKKRPLEGDVANVLRRMSDDPAGAALLMKGWTADKRKRLCQISLGGLAALLSQEDACSEREIVDALNAVGFIKKSLGRRDGVRQNASIQVSDDSILSSRGSAGKHLCSSVGAEKEKEVSRESVPHAEIKRGRKMESSEDCSRNVHRRVDVEQESVTYEVSDGNAVSVVVGRPVEGESVPQSRLIESKVLSIQTDSIGALLELLDAGATIGELTQRISRFPAVLDQKLRVLELGKLSNKKARSPHEVYFIIRPSLLEKLISRVLSFRRQREKEENHVKTQAKENGEMEIFDEEERADEYGVLFQIFEKSGRRVTECSSLTLSLRLLLDMRRLDEILKLIREAEMFISWISEIDPAMETLEEGKSVRRAKEYVLEEMPLLRAANYQGGRQKSGFGYFLESFFRLRGFSGSSRGLWLSSDTIHIAVLRLQSELREELGRSVFILPPLNWNSESCFQNGRSRACKKSNKSFGREEGANILRVLRSQGENMLQATPRELEKSVIYTVVNKGGNHWLGLEADVRTRSVLVYDPADNMEVRVGAGSEKHFTRLQIVLDLLLEEKEVSPPQLQWNEWKTSWTRGGQQILSLDAVNCGVYVVEWIKFRFHSSVLYRRRQEQEKGVRFLRKKLRDTVMCTFDEHYINKSRLLITEYSLRQMRKYQRERKDLEKSKG